MREMVFRNLTSGDHRKRIVATSEVSDKGGVHSHIRRRFICIVKDVKDTSLRPQPAVHVLKERDTRRQVERFTCRVKNSVYATYKGRLYLVSFVHSLKITLSAIHEGVAQYND